MNVAVPPMADGAVAPGPAAGTMQGPPAQQPSGMDKEQEDILVAKAEAVRNEWRRLSYAWAVRYDDPMRQACHQDFLLREMRWLSTDFAQERLWKRQAAFYFAHEAAAEGRRRLQSYAERQLAAVAAERGKPKKKEEAELLAGFQEEVKGTLEGLEESQPQLDHKVDVLTWWVNNGAFSEAVRSALEETEVSRLMMMYKRQLEYESQLETIWMTAEAKAEELRKQDANAEAEEEALGAKRIKRKPKPPPRVELEEVEEGSLGGTPTPVGKRQQEYGRDKRKRKAREFDDDDYIASNKRTERERVRLGRTGSDGNLAAQAGGHLKRLKSGRTQQQQQQQQQSLGRLDTMQRVASHQTLPGRPSLPRLAAPGMPHNWTHVDDELLCALVQEFFQSPHQPHSHAVQANWHFVADVLTSTGVLMGVARRPDWCKQRHVQLLKSAQDNQAEGHPDPVSASIVMMSKQQAKEVMVRNLPIHEGVLRKVLDVIGPLATRIADARHAERAAQRPDPKNRACDPSHLKVTSSAFQSCNSRIMSPLDITQLEEDTKRENARAQAREAELALHRQQQEQQAAVALQQQQQAAAAAAAAAAQQQQQQQAQQQQSMAQQGGMPGANAALVAAAQQQAAAVQQQQQQHQQHQQQQQQQAAMAAAQQQAAQQQAAALAAQGMGQVRSVTPGGSVVTQGGGPGMQGAVASMPPGSLQAMAALQRAGSLGNTAAALGAAPPQAGLVQPPGAAPPGGAPNAAVNLALQQQQQQQQQQQRAAMAAAAAGQGVRPQAGAAMAQRPLMQQAMQPGQPQPQHLGQQQQQQQQQQLQQQQLQQQQSLQQLQQPPQQQYQLATAPPQFTQQQQLAAAQHFKMLHARQQMQAVGQAMPGMSPGGQPRPAALTPQAAAALAQQQQQQQLQQNQLRVASFQMPAGAGGGALQAPLQGLAAMPPQLAAQMQGGAKPMQLAAQPGPMAVNQQQQQQQLAAAGMQLMPPMSGAMAAAGLPGGMAANSPGVNMWAMQQNSPQLVQLLAMQQQQQQQQQGKQLGMQQVGQVGPGGMQPVQLQPAGSLQQPVGSGPAGGGSNSTAGG